MLSPLLLSLAVATANPASTIGKDERVVVTPIQVARNIDAALVSLLGDLMLTELSGRGFQVLGYSDIQAMLDNEAQKSLLKCDGTSCLAELGDAMGAAKLIHSSLGRVGETYLVNLKLIDVNQAAVLHRVTRQVRGDEEALVNGVRAAVEELVTREEVPVPPAASPGDGPSGLALGLGGGGVVLGLLGSGLGATFGVMARDTLKFSPADPRYPAALEEAQGLATLSTVSWIAGGAAAVVGIGAAALTWSE